MNLNKITFKYEFKFKRLSWITIKIKGLIKRINENLNVKSNRWALKTAELEVKWFLKVWEQFLRALEWIWNIVNN